MTEPLPPPLAHASHCSLTCPELTSGSHEQVGSKLERLQNIWGVRVYGAVPSGISESSALVARQGERRSESLHMPEAAEGLVRVFLQEMSKERQLR